MPHHLSDRLGLPFLLFSCGVFCLSLTASTAHACRWDHDTLAEERARMPGVHEAVIGFMPVHSRAYDEWRIADRLKRLEKLPAETELRLPLYDDLSVSYDRLGQQTEAIAVLEDSLKIDSDRYETLSNMGTVLVHAGRLDEGLDYLRKAITINPDAHFGRERYQILIIEWARPTLTEDGWMPPEQEFHDYLSDIEDRKVEVKSVDADCVSDEEATKAILGMLRFGQSDSPILLTALGSILHATMCENLLEFGQQRLAARAYLRAAEHAESLNWTDLATHDRNRAEGALAWQEKITWEQLQINYSAEREQAIALQKAVEADELAWIEAGKPVDDLYHEKWLTDSLPIAFIPHAVETPAKMPSPEGMQRLAFTINSLLIGIPVLFVALIVWLIIRGQRETKRRKNRKQSAAPLPAD